MAGQVTASNAPRLEEDGFDVVRDMNAGRFRRVRKFRVGVAPA